MIHLASRADQVLQFFVLENVKGVLRKFGGKDSKLTVIMDKFDANLSQDVR